MASTFKRRQKQPSEPILAPESSSTATTPRALSTNFTSSSTSMLGLRGTKPWTGGTTLTSSGLSDLDGILGGGQPLGSCILVEEDRWTQSLALTLVRYWCAEAISQDQHLLIPTVGDKDLDDESGEIAKPCTFLVEPENESAQRATSGTIKADVVKFLHSLPRNLHWDKQQKAKLEGEQSRTTLLMETHEEDEEQEGDEANDNEECLKIAWQYRKTVQLERQGHDHLSTKSSSTARTTASDIIYCHSYDLSGRLREQIAQREEQKVEDMVLLSSIQCCDPSFTGSRCRYNRSCGHRLCQRLLHQLHEMLSSTHQPRKVVRLLLHHCQIETLRIALPLLLAQIRLHQMPVVVMVSVQPWKTATTIPSSLSYTNYFSALLSLQRSSDVVLQTEAFAARSLYPPPPEFRHLHGLLLIRKVSTVTSATAIGGGHYADLTVSKRPPANIYGLKRDRRKLHIPLLHIPPEDYADGGGSVGGGGVRSGAGRPTSSGGNSKPLGANTSGCGSGNSLLDF